MNIQVLAYYTKEFQSVVDISYPILRDYCQKHGYSLNLHCGRFGISDKILVFQKTAFALAMLPHCEAQWVVDLDLLVTNPDIRLEEFITDGFDMFACHDVNGFNSGSYLLRNTDLANQFLTEVVSLEGQPNIFGEQDAMRDVLNLPKYVGMFKRLAHPSLNSYIYSNYGMTQTHEDGDWQKGDFVLHLPGMSNEKRVEIFKGILALI